jgi:hypothetical protein
MLSDDLQRFKRAKSCAEGAVGEVMINDLLLIAG